MAKFYSIETLKEIATSDRNDTIYNHKRGDVLFSCEYVRWFDTKKERDEYVKPSDRLVDEDDEEVSVHQWSVRSATAREARLIWQNSTHGLMKCTRRLRTKGARNNVQETTSA